jgi:hypothetical protein
MKLYAFLLMLAMTAVKWAHDRAYDAFLARRFRPVAGRALFATATGLNAWEARLRRRWAAAHLAVKLTSAPKFRRR